MTRLPGESQPPLFGETCPTQRPVLREAPCMATCRVIGQESAEAIVAAGRRDYPATAKGRTEIREGSAVNS
jgi:hypothetical protein